MVSWCCVDGVAVVSRFVGDLLVVFRWSLGGLSVVSGDSGADWVVPGWGVSLVFR